MKMRRDLHPVPLAEIISGKRPPRMITMAEGQWDALLSAAYENGWVLLELDDNEKPVRAYRMNVDKTR